MRALFLPRVFTQGVRADTMRILIGLLASTGIRIAEALHLTPGDIETDHGVNGVLIGRSKNGGQPARPAACGQHRPAGVLSPSAGPGSDRA
jgi:integrase